MSDPKRQWFEHHNYKPEDVQQIALNLAARAMIAAIKEDKRYLEIIAPSSKVGPLLKDCMAMCLRLEQASQGNEKETHFHFDISDNLYEHMVSEEDAKQNRLRLNDSAESA